MVRLGIDPVAAKNDMSFNLLRKLGLSASQIDALNDVICGRQTIEGAPHLKNEHLSVFDCANKCGKTGQRFIAANGHIHMMAAAQPFISGAISKTINLPNEAGVADIKAAYRLSWELGLKANALYRDGCKLSQPLSTKSETKEETTKADANAAAVAATDALAQQVAREVIKVVNRPMRRRLPDTRASITHKFNVAGNEGYLTVGLYEDGMPGELFITMAKEGSTIGGLMDALGTSTSVALQYGVPIESLVAKFTHQRFEPAGMTTNPDIPFTKSLVDYIFRWMGMQFIPGYREANAPQREGAGEPPAIVSGRQVAVMETASDAGGRLTVANPRFTPKASHQSHDHTTIDVDVKHVHIESDGPSSQGVVSALAMAMKSSGDGPACTVCGTITVRNGTCYKCVNCGTSQGCS
jgi:ribonucleoside-diphosphate reductase alpha chain